MIIWEATSVSRSQKRFICIKATSTHCLHKRLCAQFGLAVHFHSSCLLINYSYYWSTANVSGGWVKIRKCVSGGNVHGSAVVQPKHKNHKTRKDPANNKNPCRHTHITFQRTRVNIRPTHASRNMATTKLRKKQTVQLLQMWLWLDAQNPRLHIKLTAYDIWIFFIFLFEHTHRDAAFLKLCANLIGDFHYISSELSLSSNLYVFFVLFQVIEMHVENNEHAVFCAFRGLWCDGWKWISVKPSSRGSTLKRSGSLWNPFWGHIRHSPNHTRVHNHTKAEHYGIKVLKSCCSLWSVCVTRVAPIDTGCR